MKKIVNYIGLVFVFCLMMLLAQPVLAENCGVGPPCVGMGGEIPGGNCCPVTVPFDGGLTLMLAAGGIGMGVRAMRKRKISNS